MAGSRALQSALENHLKAMLPADHTPEYALTWRRWDIAWGPQICALRARKRPDQRTSKSAGKTKRREKRVGMILYLPVLDRPISASACGGWPTTTKMDGNSSRRHGYMKKGHPGTTLYDAALFAAWPTPMAGSPATEEYNEAGNTDSSRRVLLLTPWPSPTAEGSAGESSPDLERIGAKWVNKKTGRVLQTNLATDALMVAPWPTPVEDNANNAYGHAGTCFSDLPTVAQLAAWATPTAVELGNTLEQYRAMKANMTSGKRTAITHLNIQAELAPWPTTRAADAQLTSSQAQDDARMTQRRAEGRPTGGTANLNSIGQLAPWPTPSTRDYKGGYQGGRIRDGKLSKDVLDVVAQLATWPTPCQQDGPNGGPAQGTDRLPGAAALASGSLLALYPAMTATRGALNPALSAWLMGYPKIWLLCGLLSVMKSAPEPKPTRKPESKR